MLLLVICGITYFAFSSKLSPIPFFPTHSNDLPQIIDALHLQNDQIVYDLGAGTGTVIFSAAAEAKKRGLNTKFVAIDINFILTAIMHLKRLFHPNKKHIQIVTADLFKYDYKKPKSKDYSQTTYYMYVSPWYTDPMAQLIKDAGTKAHIVSYYYPIKKVLKQKNHIAAGHDIYMYET